MFGIVLLVNIASVVVNWDASTQVPAVIAGVGALWSYGIARNFVRDPEGIPNYAVLLSILSGLGGLVLFFVGLAR